jgi:hypothetical protein
MLHAMRVTNLDNLNDFLNTPVMRHVLLVMRATNWRRPDQTIITQKIQSDETTKLVFECSYIVGINSKLTTKD